MPETTARAKFRVVINGTIEDVWNEITRTDAPIAAFFNSRLDVGRLAPGSKLAMRTPDGQPRILLTNTCWASVQTVRAASKSPSTP